MPVLFGTATGLSGILEMTVQQNHGAATAMATVSCHDIGAVDIGDSLTIDLGYTTDHGDIFTGYVKEIVQDVPNNTYTIMCQDEMIRAVDFYVAPDDPDHPPTWTNIQAEDLVENVLALAGLTTYSHDVTSFILAINGTKAEVKLITVYDYCKSIAELLAYSLWYEAGTVYFKDRRPYYTAGAILATLTDTDIISCTYRKTEKDLRNRVVVYGAGDVKYTASAVSTYLPAGFYKSVVYSHPLIGNNTVAQMTADYNLDKLNRLTYSASVNVLGSHIYMARKNVHIDSSYLPHDNYYIYGCNHSWSQGGYTCDLDLRK